MQYSAKPPFNYKEIILNTVVEIHQATSENPLKMNNPDKQKLSIMHKIVSSIPKIKVSSLDLRKRYNAIKKFDEAIKIMESHKYSPSKH